MKARPLKPEDFLLEEQPYYEPLGEEMGMATMALDHGELRDDPENARLVESRRARLETRFY